MSFRNFLREWVYPLFLFLVLLPWLVFRPSQVPTGSMSPTVLPGDVLIISKLHYGASTPRTPLHLPLTEQKIWFTSLPSYSTLLQLPTYRLPGFSSIKRGDCVAFYPPATQVHLPFDIRTPYLKRCVALPGDTVAIQDTLIYLNGQADSYVGQRQYRYRIKAHQRLPGSFFRKHGLQLQQQDPSKHSYDLLLTEQRAVGLRKLPAIKTVEKVFRPQGHPNPNVPFAAALGGSEDQLPPLLIPAKGMELEVDEAMLKRYGYLIKHYEGHQQVRLEGGKLYIEGKAVARYTFQQDYFFMVGDNFHNSSDSRFWGLVPYSHIYGKAVLVLASGKKPNHHLLVNLLTFKLRWRFFRPL